ncbi:MAG: tryptophan 2,3-dioxygenase [Candidatus Nanopelagicales bacterium]
MTSRRNPGRSSDSSSHEAPKVEFEQTTPYDAYVRASTLADLQRTATDEPGEYMFLVLSQIMELYFKLLAFEWRTAQRFLREDQLGEALLALRRSRDHFRGLNASWVSFTWMTPADFNAFRDALGEASGFQSFLYRHVEFLLGFKDPALMRPHKHVAGEHYAELVATFEAPSLYDDVLAYLARQGYAVPQSVLDAAADSTHEWDEAVEDVWVQVYADNGHGSPLRELAESLTDIAEEFSDWRYRHLMAVRRAMGAKVGTGGSAGVAWLEKSLQRQAFPELWSSRTRI